MPKKKPPHPSAGLSIVQWQRRESVAIEKLDGRDEQFVVLKGMILEPLRLDVEANHEQLLAAYAGISDEESLKIFVQQWGLPFEVPTVDRILTSAAAVKWMMQLSFYISDGDIDYLQNVMKHELDASRQFIKLLIAPYGEELRGYPHWQGLVSTAGTTPFLLDSLNEVWFEHHRWIEHGKRAPLYAVQSYLMNGLNEMMKGIQPRVDWIVDNGGQFALTHGMHIQNPWQAIVWALSKRVAGRGTMSACKRCYTLFQQKNRNKETCSEACETWWRRNHGTTRKYTRRSK